MSRFFKTVDYAATLDSTVPVRDCVPDTPLARFVADLLGHLDCTAFYACYAERGGTPMPRKSS